MKVHYIFKRKIKMLTMLSATGITASFLLLSGCSAVSSEPMTYTDTAFDTVLSVKIYDSRDESILEGCSEICHKYDTMFSRTSEESDVYRINTAQGSPVEVSEDTARLIKKGLYYGKLSDGAFDITIGTVSSLWDFKSETPSVPDQGVLSEALSHVNYKKVVVEGNTVTMQDPEAAIDLGAVAKGYIADRLKEYLEGEGVHHALIDLGGNVLAVGNKPDGSAFHIGIQKPFDESGIPLTSVKINDKSIVTSGTYQRYFEKDGVLYHHILDPASGYPCNNGLSSVSIITDSSLTADALSTTCFILGPEKGMDLVNKLDNVEAVFVSTDNEISYSNNFQKK